ncbi:MAG: M15 family metallopeptidase [Terriglobales bacterium]|jgi:hypothetical protein
MSITAPNGLEQITATFGDIQKYVLLDGTLDPRWQTEFLALVELPIPLVLSFDHSKTITHFSCHTLLCGIFADVFAKIASDGLRGKISSFGGCFAFRPQRTGDKLSTHCWGIAVDLNPESNQQGSVGDMDAGVVDVFRSSGFEWGGDWRGARKDGMHFQFCTGY